MVAEAVGAAVAAPTNAGSYVVTGTVKDVNYAGAAVATLVVAQATATVTLGDLAHGFWIGNALRGLMRAELV